MLQGMGIMLSVVLGIVFHGHCGNTIKLNDEVSADLCLE